MDIPDEWVAKVRSWAEETPEVLSVTAYGSRITGSRREKHNPAPVPDLDLAVQTRADEYGSACGHFGCLRDGWQEHLTDALGVSVDLKHHDPSDPDDDAAPYLALGAKILWP